MLPSNFGDHFNPAKMYFADMVIVVVILGITICLCLAVSGPGMIERLRSCFIFLLSWSLGVAILASQISREWERAEVTTEIFMVKNPSSFIMNLQPVTIRLNIGLSGINVTLSSRPHSYKINGSFHFDEEFQWAWAQGRDGFGPFAGSFQRQFRRGQRLGFPTEILTTADMFTLDGEGIRWGRMYRIAGWHTSRLLWVAIAFWIMTILCLQVSLAPAAGMLCVCGFLLISASLTWFVLSPSTKQYHPQVILGSEELIPSLGPAFFVCLIAGIVALIFSAILFYLDTRHPLSAAVFFGLDPLAPYDEYYCDVAELNQEQDTPSSPLRSSLRQRISNSATYESLELRSVSNHYEQLEEINDSSQINEQVLILHRRGTKRVTKFNQSILRRGQVLRMQQHSEENLTDENQSPGQIESSGNASNLAT